MYFTDEELIAYLLGDASLPLAERIEDQLESSQELAERLGQFRMLLGHMDSLRADAQGADFEPPSGLVESTLARIDADEFAAEKTKSVSTNSALDSRGLSVGVEAARSRRSLWDSTALTLSLTVLCCLALPALVRARFESRRAQCAENLRLTGRGLLSYALNDPEHRFPGIALRGPMSFAGAFSIHLHNAGFLQSIEQLSCPSLSNRFAAVDRVELAADTAIVGRYPIRIPDESELHKLSESELLTVQSVLGGTFAYSLGVLEGNRPVPPRNEGRSHFAILSDAPVFEYGQETFIAHDGFGINILYDDGRVHFFSLGRFQSPPKSQPAVSVGPLMNAGFVGDDPFCNLRGEHRIGLNEHDASLAPSHYSPFGSN